MVREEVKMFASPQSESQQDIICKLFKVARIFTFFGLVEVKRLKSKCFFFFNGTSSDVLDQTSNLDIT